MLTRTKPMGRGSKGLQRSAFKARGAGLSGHSGQKANQPRAPHRSVDLPDREQRLAARAQRAVTSALATSAMLSRQKSGPALDVQALVAIKVIASEAVPATTCPKEVLLRSEAYRRLVAAMPCACCHIQGSSQHAHENQGKGLGLKVDDRRGFPLCTVAPGRMGCHELFDSYLLVDGGREAHRMLGSHWAAETRMKIIEAGLWPKRLPLWKGDEDGSTQA